MKLIFWSLKLLHFETRPGELRFGTMRLKLFHFRSLYPLDFCRAFAAAISEILQFGSGHVPRTYSENRKRDLLFSEISEILKF